MADAARILKRRADRDKKKAEKYGVAITERIARAAEAPRAAREAQKDDDLERALKDSIKVQEEYEMVMAVVAEAKAAEARAAVAAVAATEAEAEETASSSSESSESSFHFYDFDDDESAAAAAPAVAAAAAAPAVVEEGPIELSNLCSRVIESIIQYRTRTGNSNDAVVELFMLQDELTTMHNKLSTIQTDIYGKLAEMFDSHDDMHKFYTSYASLLSANIKQLDEMNNLIDNATLQVNE